MSSPTPWPMDSIARQMAQQALQRAELARAASAVLMPSTGSAAVPALSLGASATVVVPLFPELPDLNYQPIPVLFGAASLLGGLSLLGVVARTTTSVSVQVKAPLVAVGVGATVQVTAFRTT
jgi:hypothetical protein